MKANLHINLDDIGGTPMVRTPSNSSVCSNNPHTPITTPMNRQFMFHRLNSVSSIATSEDDSDIITTRLDNNPLDSFLDWAGPDDDLLMNVYQSYLDNLTNAPFAGKIPPSGIVHQVAKATLHEAKKQGRPFLHSFLAIRKRLLLLCERRSAPIYSRASSTTSLSSTSSFSFNTPQPRYFRQLSFGTSNNDSLATPLANRIRKQPQETNQISSSFIIGHSDDEDDEDYGMSLLPPPPQFKVPEYDPNQTPSGPSSPTQPYNITSWLLNTHSINNNNANNNNNSINVGIPTPAQSPYNIKTTRLNTNVDDFDFGLDSPFKEMTVTPTRQNSYSQQQYSPTQDDPYINYTAQRKRESLRMKRGMKAPN